jgi:DNA-binding NtrC family response regulator
VLLTDANMPGMTGIELATAIAHVHPRVQVIMMSGYTSETLSIPGMAAPVALLPKPFTPQDLRQKVRDVLSDGARQRK